MGLAVRPTTFLFDDEDDDSVDEIAAPAEYRGITKLASALVLFAYVALCAGACVSDVRDRIFGRVAIPLDRESIASTETYRLFEFGCHLLLLFGAAVLAWRIITAGEKLWVRLLSLLTMAVAVAWTAFAISPATSVQVYFAPFLGQVFIALGAVLAFIFSATCFQLQVTGARIRGQSARSNALWGASICLFATLLLQALLGNVMQAADAALLVDDGSVIGSLVPSFSGAAMSAADATRSELNLSPLSGVQVGIHTMHRLGGILCFVGVLGLWALGLGRVLVPRMARRGLSALLILATIEVVLGYVSVHSLIDPLASVLHLILSAALIMTASLTCACLAVSD